MVIRTSRYRCCGSPRGMSNSPILFVREQVSRGVKSSQYLAPPESSSSIGAACLCRCTRKLSVAMRIPDASRL
eukprot:1170020-Prorocentrum_lima.AAC.1